MTTTNLLLLLLILKVMFLWSYILLNNIDIRANIINQWIKFSKFTLFLRTAMFPVSMHATITHGSHDMLSFMWDVYSSAFKVTSQSWSRRSYNIPIKAGRDHACDNSTGALQRCCYKFCLSAMWSTPVVLAPARRRKVKSLSNI